MKIIRVVTSLHFGGIERRLINLSYWHDNNEWIFVSIGKGGYASRLIKENTKKVKTFDLVGRIPSWRAFWKLYVYFRKEKPDVVHTSGAEANFHGILAAKIAGVKKVIGEEIGIPNQSLPAKVVFSFLYRFSNAVIANSEDVLEFLKSKNKVQEFKLHLIPNPIPINSGNEIPLSSKEDFRIVIVSRLEPVKNIESVIRVLAYLIPKFPFIKLTIIGEGSQRETLEKLTNNLGMGNVVTFKGFLSAPWDNITAADLFVLNSYTEGFSNALAEAMTRGIPVLATAVGAAKNLIEDGKNGWLISPSSEQELLNKIDEIIMLPKSILKEIGDNGQKNTLRNYSLESHIKSLMQIYNPQERYLG